MTACAGPSRSSPSPHVPRPRTAAAANTAAAATTAARPPPLRAPTLARPPRRGPRRGARPAAGTGTAAGAGNPAGNGNVAGALTPRPGNAAGAENAAGERARRPPLEWRRRSPARWPHRSSPASSTLAAGQHQVAALVDGDVVAIADAPVDGGAVDLVVPPPLAGLAIMIENQADARPQTGLPQRRRGLRGAGRGRHHPLLAIF